ncbi:M16 family metallopeptidase [Pedobacter cryophilus]|uniref:Insulinase family protein n=1 Tax=Pedobacter cryophilus TaxID=2571271 RepID=A0A4U1BZ83_9SPHI|nr:pitrilysin family protein [Pedobacter cryophilus]TKB97808.1 insulinase family protein [Pedobacter cryophilus]
MIDRKNPPASKAIEKVDFIKVKKHQLSNHIPVFVVNAGEQELVRIEFIFGNVNWDAAKPLLASATNTMLNDGTSNLSGAQIAAQIDYYGAFFQTEYAYDHSSVTLFTLNKHLQSTLPLVKEILTASNFPQKELDNFINNQKQKLKVSLEKNDFLAKRKFNEVLFGDTLYGYTAEETDFDALQQEDLVKYFAQAYQPKNCTILVAGKVGDDVLYTLESLFGSWNSEYPFTPNAFDFKINEEKLYFKDRPNAIQSAIRIGIPSINRKHPDFPGLQVLNTLLGGYFGSRLMNNIREDKGYTYGIGSANASLQQSGYFVIASEVGADVCDATLTEIAKEINILKTDLVPDEELQLVKNYLMGSLLGSLENAFSHADKFKNLYFYGLDYDYYDRYITTIKNISAAELLNLANKYLDFDNFYKVIVGKK